MDRYLLAVEMLGRGQYQEALPLLGQLRRELPDDLSVWLVLGNALAGAGQLHEAEGCYTTCVTLWPDSYLAYFHRGLCRFELGKFAEATDDFGNVLRLRSGFPAALVNRALAHQQLGQLQDALNDLTAALEAHATETRIYFIRSRIRQQLGDRAGAEEDRREGLQRQPSDEKSWLARGMAKLPGDPRGALDDFRQALQANRRSRDALQNVAHVLSERMNEPEDAIPVLDELLELTPNDPAIWVARGVLNARRGDRQAAIADAQHALRLEGVTAMQHQIQYQAGCIYALTSAQHPGDAKTAVSLISQAIRFEPKWLRLAVTDPDLKSLRANQEFHAVLSAASTFDRIGTNRESDEKSN